jgi:hypothetical protein
MAITPLYIELISICVTLNYIIKELNESNFKMHLSKYIY